MASHTGGSNMMRMRQHPRDTQVTNFNASVTSLHMKSDKSNNNDHSKGSQDAKGSSTVNAMMSDPKDQKNGSGCTVQGSRNSPSSGCSSKTSSLNDVDASFKYAGDWFLSSPDGNGVTGTSHQAFNEGPSVALSFAGTGVVVLGIAPPSASDSTPIASYSIDGTPATPSALPSVKICTQNQVFFSAYNLNPGNHTLNINVTRASNDAPYIINYAFICSSAASPPTPTEASSSSSSTPLSDSSKSRSVSGVVIGLIVAGIILALMLAFMTYFLVRRRRQRRLRRQLHIATSPVHSWLRRNENSDRTTADRTTVFTSTESIFRNNPTSLSSEVKSVTDRRLSSPPASLAAPPGLSRKFSTARTEPIPPLPVPKY
ncbi:hypothetical protein C8Q80DRAFT_354192 [Daedaleopsis nitida]|nr:hypothetical protein C8Q80DRAFT_354192 [Daedaleopsis nitida]